MKITYRTRHNGYGSANTVVAVMVVLPSVLVATLCAACAVGYMAGSGFTQSSVLWAAIASAMPLIIIAGYLSTVFEVEKFEFTGGLKLSFEFEREGVSSRVNDVRANQGAGSVLGT